MPKPKPDEVIRHEIVLGRAERQIVRDLQLSYTFNRVATPLTQLSPSGALALSALGLLTIDYILDSIGLDPDWKAIIADMTPEQIKDWFESQNLVGGGIGAILGAIIGLPFGGVGAIIGAAAGGVAGGAVVEGAEWAGETGPAWMTPESDTPEEKLADDIWLALLQLRAAAGIVVRGQTED